MKEELPVRKRIRLEEYDYSSENIYFVTICIKRKQKILGKVIDESIELTSVGSIVKENINFIEQIYPNVLIDEYVIMPNHIHILIFIQQKTDVAL